MEGGCSRRFARFGHNLFKANFMDVIKRPVVCLVDSETSHRTKFHGFAVYGFPTLFGLLKFQIDATSWPDICLMTKTRKAS